MIVKFTSWRYRTAVYRARKKASNKFIQLDLTSRRAGLLKSAKKKAEDHENIAFVFVDVNCNLGLKKSNGTFKFFNSDSQLQLILEDEIKKGGQFPSFSLQDIEFPLYFVTVSVHDALLYVYVSLFLKNCMQLNDFLIAKTG